MTGHSMRLHGERRLAESENPDAFSASGLSADSGTSYRNEWSTADQDADEFEFFDFPDEAPGLGHGDRSRRSERANDPDDMDPDEDLDRLTGAGILDAVRRPGGSGYKFGLAFLAGVGIWFVVSLISPATLVDTSELVDASDLTNESATAAELGKLDMSAIEVGSQDAPVALNVSGTVVTDIDGQLDQLPPTDGGTSAETTTSIPDTAETTAPDATTPAPESSPATSQATPTTAPPSSQAAPAGNPSADSPSPSPSPSPTTGGTPTADAPAPATTPSTVAAATGSLDYRSNLELIRSVSVRNKNHDGSAYRSTPSASLNLQALYGPRSEYLGNPGGNPEQAFPVANGGQFRTGCEFSHFAYDDPLIYPGKPGASHLHMYFGNTDVNAFSTYDTLLNSGSSTCNGQELNRTGYWVPALFDGNGNVRIPERIVVYYKGEGLARGNSEVYPAGAALIATENLNTLPESQGGVPGKYSFVCSDKYSSNGGAASNTMPSCNGSNVAVLEVNVKFPQCWNGKDPANWENYRSPSIGWYSSLCNGEHSHTLPNMEYFVNYRVEPGENTSNWFLSSDVDATSFGSSKATGGSTSHGDWWGGWNKEINQMWIDNCVNYKSGTASGCGFGYLTDGGPNGSAPAGGPALKMRPQYTGPSKVSAADLMAQLCPNPKRVYSKPEDAAYCAPGTGL